MMQAEEKDRIQGLAADNTAGAQTNYRAEIRWDDTLAGRIGARIARGEREAAIVNELRELSALIERYPEQARLFELIRRHAV